MVQKTGVKLNKESRVIVMPDDGGVGKSLIKLLEKEDVTVLELTATMTSEEITEQIEGWLADDPIQRCLIGCRRSTPSRQSKN